ncbi:hypothetical protein [Maricaulis sp. CAU 1757]
MRCVLTCLILLLAASAAAMAQPVPARAEQNRLAVITFNAAWCGPCHVIEARMQDVRPHFEAAPVDWVEFDFSFGSRRSEREHAAREGLVTLYDRLAGRAGFIVLYDREQEQVIEVITVQYDRDAMLIALARAISHTSGGLHSPSTALDVPPRPQPHAFQNPPAR